MAVDLTNSGFLTAAPTVDPAGTNATIDDHRYATKVTSPADMGTVTSLGAWLELITVGVDVGGEFAVYEDDAGGSEPGTRIGSAAAFTTGTSNGFKAVTGLSIALDPSTVYWLAVQVDDSAGGWRINIATSGFAGSATVQTGETALPDPWGTSDGTDADNLANIFAVYTPAAGGSGNPWYARAQQRIRTVWKKRGHIFVMPGLIPEAA